MSRWSTPAEVRALALLAFAATAACVVAVLFPPSPDSPTGLVAGAGVFSGTMGTGLLLAGRATRRLLTFCVAAMTVVVSVLVSAAATTGGAMLDGYAYVWLTVYTSLFLSRAAARGHAVMVTVGFGVGLLISGLPAMLAHWVLVSATVWFFGLALSSLAERVREQAETDQLTGVLNRHAFLAAAERERELAARTGAELAVVLIDLDGFKVVNDREGHAAGDVLLRQLAKAWRGALRPADVLARYGGDEFAVLLPATSASGAERVITRLRAAHDMAWSAGAADWEQGESLDAVLARADARLYEAKRAGIAVRETGGAVLRRSGALPGPAA